MGKVLTKLIIIAGVAIMLCGCSVNVKIPEEETDNITKEEEPTLSEEQQTISTYGAKELNVVYMGNSMLMVGNQPEYLAEIGKTYGVDIENTSFSCYGYSLQDHLDLSEKGTLYEEKLAEADVVIFQEYGGQYFNTYKNMKHFIQYCKDDAQIFYYMAETDYEDNYLIKIAKDERIHIIPAQSVIIYALTSGIFEPLDLNLEDGYHPTTINGYISALVMFSAITGNSCMDYLTMSKCGGLCKIFPQNQIANFSMIFSKADEILATYESNIAMLDN